MLATMTMKMMMLMMSIRKPNRSKLRFNFVPSGESDNIKYEEDDKINDN